MSETITLTGKKATSEAGEMSIEEFSREIVRNTVHGLHREPMADIEKWRVECGEASISIVGLNPELRCLKWPAPDSPEPFGPLATYRERELATPYMVLVVPFLKNRVLPLVEVFYRNEPLTDLDGPGGALFWPNFLNVSPNAYGCTCWFCTQYLPQPGKATITEGLNAVIHHLLGGSFNSSSEEHEGSSTWSRAVADKVDPRVTDVDRWQEESIKDPNFILTVKWRPTGMTVRNVVESKLRAMRVATVPDTAEAIGSILLRKKKPR